MNPDTQRTFDAMVEGLTGMLKDAGDLRKVSLPAVGADGQTLVDTVLEVRQRLDRIEEIHVLAVNIRNAILGTQRELDDTAADAWDNALLKQRRNPIGVNEDFVAAKERYAQANLDTMDHRLAQRAAAEYVSHATTAVESIRLMYRGLADTRQDLLAILRNIQFESTLDR